MSPRNSSRGAARPLLLLAVVILTGLLVFTYFRRGADDDSVRGPDDGLTYEQRVAPLVAEAAKIAGQLSTTNNPLAVALQAGARLRGQWQEARTARGYDRARHDGFILTFNQFFNALQSVDTISSVLNAPPDAGGGIPEARKLETLFALQGVHGAETGAQLISKTGLSTEALLSRTNLIRELGAGVQSAITQQTKARQVLEQLAPAGTL